MVVNVPATRNDVLTYDTYSLYGVCDVCACVGVMGGRATLKASCLRGSVLDEKLVDTVGASTGHGEILP